MTGFLLILIVVVAAYFASRVGALERRIGLLERGHVPGQARDKAPEAMPAPQTRPQPRAAAPQKSSAPPRPPRPALGPRLVAPPRARRFDWGRTVSAADLMGAKALAFAGGVVTLLGVIFFFVLAVNRGWIGPELRVACGGLASAVVFAGGMWLHRRYGPTYSALAAVGVGIAGSYATLLAAVSLY